MGRVSVLVWRMRREDPEKGHGKSAGCVGGEARLYPMPIYFPPFINKEKRTGIFIYLFLVFITQCEAPGSGGLTPLFMKKEQWVYQQKLHQMDEIPGNIIAAIMELLLFFMCVFGFAV